MRLTSKLTAVMIAVMSVLFCAYGYVTLERQSLFIERDMKNDGMLVGVTIAKAAANIWMARGVEAAIAFVDDVDEDYANFQIRFVKLPSLTADEPHAPLITISPTDQRRLLDGPLVINRATEAERDYLYTYVPIQSPDGSHAAVEIRESFAQATQFVQVSGIRLALMLAVIILSTAGVMWMLGILLVARPIARLSEKAKQIAQGDYSGHAVVSGGDEIASLATDINTMSDRLHETRLLLDEETAARIHAIEQLRHADRLTTLGTLSTGLAHELGTPLNVLSGRLQLCMTDHELTPELQEHVEIAVEQTQKMAAIISQLLDFSRARTPTRERSDLNALSQRVIRTLAPFAMRRQTILKFSSQGSSAVAHVDATQIEQVITNLLLNAIQSMEDSGGEILLGVDTKVCAHPEASAGPRLPHIHVWVRDSGLGISSDDAERMFDPFFTTKDVGKGTGMGLSIAYGIVKEHGGWIDVETEIGEGSCFSVYLPYEALLQ